MTFAEGLTGFMIAGALVGAAAFFYLKWCVRVEPPVADSGRPKGKKR